MRLLSIDFGTSNTVVALANPGQAARAVTFDASPLLPSAVYLAADGSVTVGRDAQRQARLDPTRFEPNPKRRIDDGEVLLGDRVVEVVDLIAAVLRTVAVEVRRQLGGGLPDEVRLTHPAQWGATRQNTLISAARKAGLGTNLVLIPEPVAAAAQYTQLPGRELRPGGSVAVYDLGGGTLDIAVVGRTQNEFHVLAEAGLPDLGGLDFDQAVLEHVGRTASSADPGRWQQILRPVDAPSRRAARALAEDVKAAKETLSRYPQTEVALPEPFTDVHLTRPEFEGLIRPNLLRSIEVLQTTLRSAGVGAQNLTGIFLVGGSSRVPLVAKLIAEQLGVTPVALDQPETAVALGALLVPTRSEGGRTVAYGDPRDPASGGHSMAGGPGTGPHPPMTPSGPASGRQQVAGQASGPQASGSPSGPQPSGSAPSSGPASGPHPTGRQPGGYRPPDVATSGGKKSSRTPLLVGGGVVALLVVIAVILLVVQPFSDSTDPKAGDGGTSSSGQTSVSGGGSQGGGGSGSGTTPAVDPAGNEPGVGPDNQLTPNELAFLGDAANSKLINCGDNTDSINDRVPAEYSAKRILGCEVAGTDDPDAELYGRTLVYVFTLDSPEAADALMDQITADREGELIGDDPSGTTGTSAGTLRLVAAAQLPPLGETDQGEGRPAIAWSLEGKPYVAMMVSLRYTATSDLVDYFEKNYKPR